MRQSERPMFSTDNLSNVTIMWRVKTCDRRKNLNDDDKDPQVREPPQAVLSEQLDDMLVPREPTR